MSRDILEQVVARAVGDAAFRQLLRTNPTAALREFRLSPDERAALTSADPAKLSALGIDQRMSRLLTVETDSSLSGAYRVASDDVNAAAGVDIDAGASGASPTAATPTESLIQTNLRLVEGRLDTLGGPEIHAGDSLPADYGADRLAAEGGAASRLARIEGDFDTVSGEAVTPELDTSMIDAGVVIPPDTVGGLYRLREGAEPAAGDATPAGEAPFRTDIYPDHEAAPAGAVADVEGGSVGPSLLEAHPSELGFDTSAVSPGTYEPESGQYDFTARDFEGAETGDVQAVEEPDKLDSLYRTREIEGSDQGTVDTTTDTGDTITE